MITDLASAQWFKSSFSLPSRECVEVAFLAGDQVAVRDSKNPSGPALEFPVEIWDQFLARSDWQI